MDTTTPPATPAPTTEDKTVAILSYLTLIGFIVAIVLHSNKKTRLGAFHLRQVLGFFLTAIACWICVAIMIFILTVVLSFMKSFVLFLIPLIHLAVGVSVFVLWLLGFIAALNGQMKPMPVVGPMYQKWFANVFE